MYQDYGVRLRAIRIAEGLTQQGFSELTGIGLSTIKSYEIGREIGLSIIDKVLNLERFQCFTLWLMIGKSSEAAGQISPPLAHTGHAKTESPLLTGKAG